MKRNYWRSIISMILSVMLVFSMTMTIFAETTIINNPDGTVTERNTDEIKEGTGGDYSVTINITENTTGTLNDGSEFESKVEKTTTTDYDDYRVDHTEWTEEGYSKTTQTEGASDVTVNIPLEEGASDSAKTEVEEPNPKTEGDVKTGDDDTEYNYTVTTVTPGEVTVTTKDITVTETVIDKVVDENGNVIEGTDLDYVYSEVTPVKGNAEGEVDNDLIIWIFRGHRTELPKEGEEIEVKDGYEYKYVGTGNTSQFLPAFLYKSPSPDNPDEEPAYIDADGNKYYTRGRSVSPSFSDIYHNGERQEAEDNGLTNIFSVPQQFILVDAATGELITTYCADADTPTESGFNYNIENLEDADYYSEEQAAMIRTIAENGYWGTTSGEGSLDNMKQELLKTGKFTESELENLTDGLALSVTQMAIWTFSNAMSDMAFLNAQYTKDGNTNNEVATDWAGQLLAAADNVTHKKDSIDLLFKLYDHLINMDPTPAPEDGENPTTADTIINTDNFIQNLSITVLEKAEEHENNKDEDKTNDAYVTNLTFALVVEPAQGNNDDLVVTVIDGSGNVVASGKIAGELKEGEEYLECVDGNYTFSGITMIEGDSNFNITLQGVQNLKEGVYLYTSEVEDGVSSQTMVGKAGGQHAVNVSMDISFNVDVDDEITVIEHFWSDEGYEDNPPPPSENTPPPPTYDNPPPSDNTPPPPAPRNTPPEDGEEIPEDPVPLNEDPDEEEDYEEGDEITILDEEIPLAEVPETGDASDIMMLVAILAVIGLIAVNLPAKKRYNV